jgi:hypothetical protein
LFQWLRRNSVLNPLVLSPPPTAPSLPALSSLTGNSATNIEILALAVS